MPNGAEDMYASSHRILVSHAPPEAYAPMTRAILAKLGYAILLPEEFEALAQEASSVRPVLRIVDERQLGEVPEDATPVPILVLTGRHGVTGADARIVGAIRRPAGMHELYRLVQQVTEDTPRATPRIPTHLPARCCKDGREWPSTVLSLSENGCLVRSPEPLLLGSRLELEFDLPRAGTIRVSAETAYQLLPDLGLIFHATPTRDRDAIKTFLTDTLLR
ncbi:MAG: PilZ domain-containing protein [Myxococcales bacterium]|nr:PilZ domain-containing protein [Myxococcales bacterium]MDH5567367.1 PilZ domain-containing protein [Myxococcales bacterium]